MEEVIIKERKRNSRRWAYITGLAVLGLAPHSHSKPRIGIVTSAVALCATPPLIAVSVLPLSHSAIDDFLLPEPPELHLSSIFFCPFSFFFYS